MFLKKDKNENLVRKKWVFTGIVQGVGFRYLTMTFAKEFGVTGYIKNMPDGSVVGEFQGTAAQLAKVLNRISYRFGSCIKDVKSEDLPVKVENTFDCIYF